MHEHDFGDAVRRRLGDLGRTHGWLADQLGYHQTTITGYINGKITPKPADVFAIEAALQLAPGTLSQTLGYLPVDRSPGTAVVDAIAADPSLTDPARRALLAAYRELVT